eukprot:PITA_17096
MENLKRLKKATISWAKDRKVKQNEELIRIREELNNLESTEEDGYISQASKEWRLKSRAIWLKAGDENTNFFHNYAKGIKSANTIWSLKDEEGREVSTFLGLSGLGQRHFQRLFSDSGLSTIAEVIRTAQCFPRFVKEGEAEELSNHVSKEEVEAAMKIMAKDKSPELDGWTIELFLFFFDLVGSEITDVVEESRQKGEAYNPFNSTFVALIPKKTIRRILKTSGRSPYAIVYIRSLQSYAVLINGATSSFFRGQRGLRQGCPLSPLLFLLVAEGLSRLIHKARREEKVKGIEVAINLFITHLLFVDDILIFSNGSYNELKELRCILDLFLKATGMQINSRKSQVSVADIDKRERTTLLNLFPFQYQPLDSPLKYLGFWLKLTAYKKEDWKWIIAKLEARISHWSFKWLSRAGKLTLIKSVLLAIPVYWATLTWVPKGVLEKIRRICYRFLWAGSKESSVLPWVAWDKLARPKEWGGWGLKRLPEFSLSLAAKSGWRLISLENL